MSETIDVPASNALTVIPATAVSTIVAADESGILAAIAKKVAAFKPDISTTKGRDEMRTLAREIASSKVALVKIGKGLTEKWRTSTKAVNEECNIIEERMDALRDKVRAPLTAWEQVEKDRVAGHEAALAGIFEASAAYGQTETADELSRRLEHLNSYPARDWQEFSHRAREVIETELTRTQQLHAAAVKREAEAAELARLRAEAEERTRQETIRLQAEREAQIAAEAAAKAKREAEALAEQERQRAERDRLAAIAKAEADATALAAKVEADRIAAAATIERERGRAAKAEADRVAAIAKAEADAKAAAERAEAARVAAAERAEADRKAAVLAEQKRAANAKAAQDAADAKRAADVAHRTRINREALTAVVLAMSEVHSGDQAEAEAIGKAIIQAIAKAAIPAVTITY